MLSAVPEEPLEAGEAPASMEVQQPEAERPSEQVEEPPQAPTPPPLAVGKKWHGIQLSIAILQDSACAPQVVDEAEAERQRKELARQEAYGSASVAVQAVQVTLFYFWPKGTNGARQVSFCAH